MVMDWMAVGEATGRHAARGGEGWTRDKEVKGAYTHSPCSRHPRYGWGVGVLSWGGRGVRYGWW